jgi:hypothetical protein
MNGRRAFIGGLVFSGLSLSDSLGGDIFSRFQRGILDRWIDPAATSIDPAYEVYDVQKILSEISDKNIEEKVKRVVFKKQPLISTRPLRLGIMVGHNKEESGADGVGEMEGVSEYTFSCEQAEILSGAVSKLNGIECKVFYRQKSSGGYPTEIKNAYNKMWADYKPDCSIELHFNSSTREAARYTCVLSQRYKKKSTLLAGACMHAMCTSFSSAYSKERYPDHGFVGGLFNSSKKALKVLDIPSVILEPTFAGSNEEDASLLLSKRENMARALVAAIRDIKPGLIS